MLTYLKRDFLKLHNIIKVIINITYNVYNKLFWEIEKIILINIKKIN